MVFLVDEARGRTVDAEIQLAVGFPLSDEAEREFAVFDGRKIKLLIIGVLLVTVGVDLREQEGAGTRLYVLARTGLEDLHAMGSCFLVGAVLVVGHGGLAYNLLDVFELEGGSRMGVSGKANQRADLMVRSKVGDDFPTPMPPSAPATRLIKICSMWISQPFDCLKTIPQ